MDSPIITVKDLGSKSKNNYVYKNINFEIERGNIVGLLGHNGAGKSTLLRNISNLEKPQYGEVYINGEKNNINKFNKNIVIISDKVELIKNLTILDNLNIIQDSYGYDKEFFETYLKKINLTHSDIIGELSKGNQEIVQLIILLSLNTKIILLDEPFSAIDIFRREFINEMLIDINLKHNKTLIITTHLIEEIQDVLSQVIYLHNGKITLNKNMEEIQQTHNSLVDFLKDYFKGGEIL